jgi:hypothetical protein
VRQSEPKGQAWYEDSTKMGYGPPLPAPIPAVQTTLAAIDVPEFHSCVHELDLIAINDVDEEGVHAPMRLDTLDFATWIFLFVLATTDRTRTVARLKSAQTRLPDLCWKTSSRLSNQPNLLRRLRPFSNS